MPVESNADFAQICQQCRNERQAYFQKTSTNSPACITLFRLALQGNQNAWAEVHAIFTPLLHEWIGTQAKFEIEDIAQETWLAFHKGPEAGFKIIDNERLEPILQYLKTCTKRVILQLARKPVLGGEVALLDEVAQPIYAADEAHEAIALRLDLEKSIQEFLEGFAEEDRLLFGLKFIQQLKPREIMAGYPERFPDYSKLEIALQRISRRTLQHKPFRDLSVSRQKSQNSALLKIVIEDKIVKREINVDQPCMYDEVILLDYIMKLVSPEVATAIESSSACLQQAQRLAQEFTPFLQTAYRLHCPKVETLTAYQQKELAGTERLLVYRHIAACTYCQADLVMINEMDRAKPEVSATLLRRVVEALFQSPLAFGLQGEWHHYQAPQVFIHLSVNQNSGKQRAWTVRAQLRTDEGHLITGMVESATLQLRNGTIPKQFQTTSRTGESSLVFREVIAGEYSLHVVMPDQEIVVRQISIGADL